MTSIQTALGPIGRLKEFATQVGLFSIPLVRRGLSPRGYAFKRLLLHDLAVKHRCSDFVETGTSYGVTARFMARRVAQVLTCEPYPPLFEYNQKRNRSHSNIILWNTGSETCFRTMLEHVGPRPMFWLDGHYSGKATAHTGLFSPIEVEISTLGILTSPLVIAIDDVRLFHSCQNELSGTFEEGYPAIENVVSALRTLRPANEVRIVGDCLLSVP